METLAKDVADALGPACELSVLSLGRGNRHLPWWLPAAVARTVWRAAVRRRVDTVLLGDAVVNTAVGPLLRLARVPYATMVMGLDVTWGAPGYRTLIRAPLATAPRVVAISRATADAAVSRGARPGRTSVLRLAIAQPPPAPTRAAARRDLVEWLGVDPGAYVVTTLGRLVPRKGMLWFAREVLPSLPDHVHYVVAGRGPDLDALRDLAAARPRLHVIGPVDDARRETLLRGADLFVQPNVPVPGDMEGFGLVTLEAAVRDLPVLASALEGIQDVIADGATGRLLPPGDPAAWRDAVAAAASRPEDTARAGRQYGATARDRFSLDRMGTDLLALLPGRALTSPGARPPTPPGPSNLIPGPRPPGAVPPRSTARPGTKGTRGALP
jgi:glycosyltransferase involved in cell wall biosynthesis